MEVSLDLDDYVKFVIVIVFPFAINELFPCFGHNLQLTFQVSCADRLTKVI